MQRSIKFRARGETSWWYGCVNPENNGEPYGIKHEVNLATFFPNLYSGVLDPETLGQYTGLKDKWESDIVLLPDEYKERILDDGSGPVEPFNHLAPIVFQDGCFGLQITDGGEIFTKGFWSFDRLTNEGVDIYALEVIGNKWENPKNESLS